MIIKVTSVDILFYEVMEPFGKTVAVRQVSG